MQPADIWLDERENICTEKPRNTRRTLPNTNAFGGVDVLCRGDIDNHVEV